MIFFDNAVTKARPSIEKNGALSAEGAISLQLENLREAFKFPEEQCHS